MSNSFLELILATTIGAGVFFLITEVYYEIKARILGRKYEEFIEELEEELQK
jgi:hypothetical protein